MSDDRRETLHTILQQILAPLEQRIDRIEQDTDGIKKQLQQLIEQQAQILEALQKGERPVLKQS